MRELLWLPRLLGLCLAGVAGAQSERPPGTEPKGLDAFPADPNRGVVLRACVPCHVPELVLGKRRTAAEWDELVAAMVDRGAVATEDEQLAIVSYLERFFGQETSSPSNK